MMKFAGFFAVFPILSVFAAVDPLEPAPGDVYKPGSTCPISWSKDATGTWTSMNIELMSGSNEDMVHLTTVTTLDGTTKTSFSWDCPEVTPNAAIYFYQFSSATDPTNLTWTGRFAISDASGSTTDPTETTDGVAWGTGSLVDSSDASAAPTYLDEATASGSSVASATGSNNSTATSTGSTAKASTSALGALTATGSLTTSLVTRATTASVSDSDATQSSIDTSSSSGAASLLGALQSLGLQALLGLTSTAIVFSTML